MCTNNCKFCQPLPLTRKFLPDTIGFLVPTFFSINRRKCGHKSDLWNVRWLQNLPPSSLLTIGSLSRFFNANRKHYLNGDIFVDDLDPKIAITAILILVNNCRDSRTQQLRSTYQFGSSGISTLNLKELISTFLFHPGHSACQVRKLTSPIMGIATKYIDVYTHDIRRYIKVSLGQPKGGPGAMIKRVEK